MVDVRHLDGSFSDQIKALTGSNDREANRHKLDEIICLLLAQTGFSETEKSYRAALRRDVVY